VCIRRRVQRITPDIAAMCVSCPTNPTGNVLTQNEFDSLHALADAHGIPLILDNAYGHPFPGVIHNGFQPKWQPGMIFSISMSKVGLPGVRTAAAVGYLSSDAAGYVTGQVLTVDGGLPM
jgi:valine--pyruvate aminotransferase